MRRTGFASILMPALPAILLMACATPATTPNPTPAPEQPQPAADVRSDIVPPEDIDVVQVEVFDEDDLRCYLVRWPGSRMVVGERCELVNSDADGIVVSVSDSAFDPLEWEREILAPGVYRMTRRR